ncbi:MAG: hypothetical protein ACREFI_14015 [Stellaceae bacterium]
MKTFAAILGAAATLLASNAFAADSITGTVHTYCMNGAASCRAYIDTTVGGIQKRTELTGKFSAVAKLDGKIATVGGIAMCLNGGDSCRFLVKSVKAAAAQPLIHTPTTDTHYGVVHSYCMNGASTCRAILSSNGKDYTLGGDFSKLAKFDGKIVEVSGNERCLNGGDTCRLVVDSIKKVAAVPLTAAPVATGSNVAIDSNTVASIPAMKNPGHSSIHAGVAH